MAFSDIEDIVDIEDSIRSSDDGQTMVVWKTSRIGATDKSIDISPYIENTQKVFIKTWGCSHNNSDGEYMKGQLAHAGYDVINGIDQAHICILNSCTVKDPSEAAFVNAIRHSKSLNIPVVLAGCVPQGDSLNKLFKGISIIGVKQIDRVVEVVRSTLEGNTVRFISRSISSGGASLSLPKIRRNRFVEILPINTGCLNNCTYCKTKHSRGQLASYHPEDIVDRVKQVIKEGVKEIWFTSEDLGAYGLDIGTSLSDILWQVLDILPKGIFIRLGMTNPPYILSDLGRISQILKHPQVFAFLHIPVQAGSSRVLEKMARDYVREDFEVVVDFLKLKIPDIHVATDVICGFPTETDLEFDETVSLVQKYKFPAVHISQFYARRGTPAASMPRVPSHIIKARSRKITNAFYSYRSHQHKLGREYNVVCTEMAKDNLHLVTHNKSYDQILVKGDPNALLGKCFRIQVESCDKFHMMGTVIPGTVSAHLDLMPIVSSENQLQQQPVSPCPDKTDTRLNELELVLIPRPRYRCMYELSILFLLIALAIRCWRSVF